MENVSLKNSVYALLHPITGEVRYIGVTSKKPELRLNQHIGKARRLSDATVSTPLCRWINKLSAFGFSPQIIVLAKTVERDKAERHWIAYYRSDGVRLLSQTDGGGGFSGLEFSLEHRRKIGEALRGRARSPEILQMLSRVHKGKVLSEETRSKMSEVRKGKTQTETTKSKRSATMKGRTYCAERCANISAGRKRALAGKRLLELADANTSAS